MSARLRMSRRTFLQGSAAVGVGLVAAQCAPFGAPQGKLKGATINYLGWEGYDYEGAIKPLLDEFDMTLNSTYGGNNEEIFSKLKAGSKGQYDVISIYHGTIEALYLNDLIQPIDTGKVEHWDDLFDVFTSQPWQVIDGKVYSVPFTFGNTPCTYNPEFLPDGIESWSDLFKPEYTGHVVALDAANQEIYVALSAIGVDINQLITKDQLAAAKEWYLQLKPQLRAIVPSYGEMADMLAREEAWVTSGSWTAIIGWAGEKGVTLDHVIPKEGTAGWCDNYLIPQGANAGVAYAFINQMTSPEGAKELGEYLGQEMTNSKVVPLLPADMQAGYDNIDAQLKITPFPPDPPLEPEDPNIASMDDWNSAWEDIKAS